MILVYTEKPYLGCILAPHFRKYYPAEKIVVINSFYFRNTYFKYPHNIKWNDYPYINSPSYHINNWEEWCPSLVNANGKLEKYPFIVNSNGEIEVTNLTTEEVATATLFYAADPGYSCAFNFSIFVEKFYNTNVKDIHIDSLNLWSLDEISINRYFAEKCNFYDTFKEAVNYGKVISYFNYLYNVNSLAIFGATLRSIGIDSNQHSISKASLQLLYKLAEDTYKSGLKEGQILQIMSKWTGTGKYPKYSSLGSCTSQSEILQNLKNMDFLVGINKKYSISPLGLLFLSKLHKDCMDQDLPFRLEQWGNLEFEEAKKKIDSYIKNFFGKQKRKLNSK